MSDLSRCRRLNGTDMLLLERALSPHLVSDMLLTYDTLGIKVAPGVGEVIL